MHPVHRTLAVAALVGGLALPARPAQAGFTLAASVGLGGEVKPLHQVQGYNLMVAPGYEFFGFLRPELGIVGALEAARKAAATSTTAGLGLEFRPMLVLTAPVLPLYLRLVFAAVNPFDDTRTIAYGGALGTQISILGLGVFGEFGVLPRSQQSQISWILEGRLGAIYEF